MPGVRRTPSCAGGTASRRRCGGERSQSSTSSHLLFLELADGVCGICGEDVDPTNYHVDHIVPISRGGEHSYANTQPAHPACNQRKHNKLQEEMA